MEYNCSFLAIALLLVVMTASIAVAIIFPYVDLNAKKAAALLDMDDGGSGEGRGRGSAAGGAFAIGSDTLMGDTSTNDKYVTIALTKDPLNKEHTAGESLIISNSEANNNNEDGTPASTRTQHNNLFGSQGNNQEEKRLHPRCQSLLRQTDLNTKGLLTESEYATLVAELLQGVAPHSVAPERYSDLPFQLKMNFLHLSCVCLDCCVEENGIYIGEHEQQHGMRDTLDVICEQTEAAIRKELEDYWAGA